MRAESYFPINMCLPVKAKHSFRSRNGLRLLTTCAKGGFLCIGISISAFRGPCALRADIITNRPSADTTLFETFPNNNLGATDLTSGSTAAGLRSRALIQFDISAMVPPTATIDSVTLTLTATRQPPGGHGSVYRLFRLLQPWGEGNKTGIHGAPADPGEASWNDRFASEPGGGWSVPGAAGPKDFSPVPGASLFVGAEGRFTFASSSNLVTDAQFWLNEPTNNYGWIVISDAESVPQTVTHFGSREDPTNAPILVIGFTLPATGQRLSIDRFAIATNTFILGFTAAAERSFTVQYLESLSTTNWQILTNVPAQSAGSEVLVTDPIHSPQRFYRAVLFEAQVSLHF